MSNEKLFSYGTLRYEEVQLSTFGRKLQGTADTLLGYRLSKIAIKDPKVVATSGDAEHPILIYTGNNADEVSGMVFDITAKELQSADEYEVSDYKRVSIELRSGMRAWVYVSVA
jgi:gamma-glutamylcyclotransferase (GGCT)/AIG2-like uncharacterized protein YtfP